MRRIMKYIKPFWGLIVLDLIMVSIMAYANLSLPEYLSRIVNVGIQQNGIEKTVPEAVRASFMDKLAVFQSPEEHTAVLAGYHLVEPGSAEAVGLVSTYPTLEQEPIYVLNALTSQDDQAFADLMSRPMVLVQGVSLLQNNPEQAKAIFGNNMPFDISKLPAGMDLFTLIQQLPQAQRDAFKTQVGAYLNSLQGSILKQVVIQAVSAEYKALGMSIEKVQTNFILRIGALMLLVSLISVITSLTGSFLASRTSAGVARDLRSAVFQKVTSFSSAEFENFSTASLITRSTNDVTQVQQLVFMIMRMAFTAPLIATIGIIRAFDKSPNMWWLIALAVAVIIVVISILLVTVMPKFKIMQTLIDKINLVLRENLSGIMVVRAFNKQEFEENRFDVANQNLTNNMRFVGRAMVFLFPIINLIFSGLSIAIIWVGAHEVAQSALQVGDLIAFMQYSMQIVMAFIGLSVLFVFLPRAAVSGARIADVLETPLLIKDPAEPKTLPEPVKGVVHFEDVDFRYPDAEADVLHDITFTANPGQVTSIIGSTGCGKSTLVNLIPRFYEVSKGRITLDGVDIRDITQQELRDEIGYTAQRGILFSGTIASNMQLAKADASLEEMNEALRIAQASDFVLEDPNGVEREIAQNGTNVSGGQKQRLSIARSLVKKPPIYIFDDTFSALDFKTDSMLRAALKDQVKDSTVLIVTQRVATAMGSDQILVLESGRVVGLGTHKDLMRDCQTYQEIANSQLSKEELA